MVLPRKERVPVALGGVHNFVEGAGLQYAEGQQHLDDDEEDEKGQSHQLQSAGGRGYQFLLSWLPVLFLHRPRLRASPRLRVSLSGRAFPAVEHRLVSGAKCDSVVADGPDSVGFWTLTTE